MPTTALVRSAAPLQQIHPLADVTARSGAQDWGMSTITFRDRLSVFPSTRDSVLYWIPTVLLALVFFASFTLGFTDLPFTISEQERLGFPGWSVIPSDILKFLGAATLLVNALTNNRFSTLTYFALAGFLYDMLLALGGHIATSDPGIVVAIVGLTVWVFAFIAHQRRFATNGGPGSLKTALIR